MVDVPSSGYASKIDCRLSCSQPASCSRCLRMCRARRTGPTRQDHRPLWPGGHHQRDHAAGCRSLFERFGQPFVLDNRGGAGGAIGTEFAARAPRDGYWIYIAGGSPLTVVPLMQKVSYDPVKELLRSA